jgi:hypothetical protein
MSCMTTHTNSLSGKILNDLYQDTLVFVFPHSFQHSLGKRWKYVLLSIGANPKQSCCWMLLADEWIPGWLHPDRILRHHVRFVGHDMVPVPMSVPVCITLYMSAWCLHNTNNGCYRVLGMVPVWPGRLYRLYMIYPNAGATIMGHLLSTGAFRSPCST